MTEPGFRCSDAARIRGDELWGTAPPATRWLLIEYPGAWSVDALGGSTVAPEVRRQLTRSAERNGIRILLIRRPLRRGSETQPDRLWTVITRGAGEVRGRWRDDQDLLEAVRTMDAPAPTGADHDRPEPMILVCTHGVHDLCCAVRGRPVAAALAARWPEQTWECSHVGGDRFAANLVVLPDGIYYGDLDAASAVQVVADHRLGLVSPDHLRGVSGYPPAAQAVMGEAYRRRPDLAPGSITMTRMTGDRRRGWSVELAASRTAFLATVTARSAPPARLTCRAPRDSSATLYRLAQLTITEQP